MILDSNHLNVLLFPNATKKATFLPFLPYDALKKNKIKCIIYLQFWTSWRPNRLVWIDNYLSHLTREMRKFIKQKSYQKMDFEIPKNLNWCQTTYLFYFFFWLQLRNLIKTSFLQTDIFFFWKKKFSSHWT